MVITIALILIVARLLAEWVLFEMNLREVTRNAGRAPDAVAAMMDEATYQKSVAYTQAKSRFNRLTLLFDAGVLALVLVSGILPQMFAQIGAWAPGAHFTNRFSCI